MKKVIYVGEEPNKEKGVEFTFSLNSEGGWLKAHFEPTDFEKIVYLGKCEQDGDMFAAYTSCGFINIFKGHLNNGTH
jgi:hypothetical protein